MKFTILSKTSSTYLLLIVFFIHQLIYISKGGTTWDDFEIYKTTTRVIDKAYWFFVDRSNSFLGDFNYNLEYYGYLIPIIIFLLTNLLSTNEMNLFLFKNIMNADIISELDLIFLTRNLLLNVYVIVLLILIYKVICKNESHYFGFLFLIFLIFIPSFNGHALFNIKDVPFALQYLLAVIFVLDSKILTSKVYRNKIPQLILIGLVFGSVVLVRFNGYAFLLLISFYLFVIKFRESLKNIKNLFTNWSIIYITSFITLIVFSPSAWNDPIFWLKGVYNTQFNLDWLGSTLTNGRYIYATEMEPSYIFSWFFFRLPLVYTILFFITILIFIFQKKFDFSKYGKFSLFLIISVFLLFSIVRPISYDGIRQYLFLLPFFTFIVVDFFMYINKTYGNKLFMCIFLPSIFYLIGTQVSLGEYKYVYFNEIINEAEITKDCNQIGGCGNWETDYWGFSIKQLMSTNIESDNFIYCEPIHIFSTYKEREDLKVKPGTVFVSSLHRKMDNTLCPSEVYELDNCEIYHKEEAYLRRSSINLSYIYQCEKN